jgi:exosortase E/protease (VPEID-CTERM system)
LAWFVGVKTEPYWPWLGGATLKTSAAMLALFFDGVSVDVPNSVLGLGDFAVIVGAPCSGIDGLAGVSVCLLGYLLVSHAELRFPHTLAIVPVALGAVWLLNAARIAALTVVGAFVSPAIAYGGFHSKAGWIGFCLVVLGSVVVTRKSRWFVRDAAPVSRHDNPTAAYAMPFLTLLALGMVTELFRASVDWLYAIRIVGASAVCLAYRKQLPALVPRFSWQALALGALAFLLWLALAPRVDAGTLSAHEREFGEANAVVRALWLTFRVAGAVVVVPIVEELAFRGFLQRRLIAENFTQVSLQKLSFVSLAGSALAFGLMHDGWLAGAVAGGLYSLAGYRRGRLEDAIVAHATTNALLVAGALVFGQHDFWY